MKRRLSSSISDSSKESAVDDLEIVREGGSEIEAGLECPPVQFETLLDLAPLGVYVVDQNFRFCAVNQRALPIFEHIPDLIGRDFDEIVRILWPQIFADEVLSRFRHTLETGEPYLVTESVEERRDRAELEGYEWQINRVALSGNRYGVVCYFREISEFVRSREALRASEQKLRFVMDSMPQKVFTADTTGSVTYFNPQWSEFTGLSFEEIRDWGWTKFIHPEDLAENLRVWKHAIATGEKLLFEHRFRRADGEYRWHSSRVWPIHDDEGRVTMWIGSNTDIDDVMRTKDALEEANRRKDDFLATVSHEVRTPLTSILGWTGLMTMFPLDERIQREGTVSIHQSALAQVKLVDDLLDTARVVSGKLQLTIAPLDIETVVREALAALAPSAEAKGHRLEVSIEPHLPSINGDAIRLQQVMWNLLSNAVKFTPAGGRIGVRVFSDDTFVHFEVSDSGIGIRPDFLPNAFDRFAQEDTGPSRRQGGLGIGLSLVKQLVELHGGTVSVQSAGEGQGCIFTVSLRVSSVGAETTIAEPASDEISFV